MSELNYLSLDSAPNPAASVIWLHGLGASGHDFEDIPRVMKLASAVRFIFPHAPERPVTVNQGYIMPAWYDILEMSAERRIDKTHLHEAVNSVWQLVEQELARGVPSERIVLAGFSQGGAVAYHAMLNYRKPLAGLLCMSTYITDQTSISYASANKNTPILIQHGSFDPIVLESQGLSAYEHLKSKNYNVNYQCYPMEHQLCPPQVRDINHWLNAVLGEPIDTTIKR